MYRKINLFLQKFFKESTIFRYLFNISPMYRRSCGRIVEVSDDITQIIVRVKLSWKNRNYAGTMFGGSMFSASDPILMIQYLALLKHEYIVWDKSANIQFKKPAREDVWIEFNVNQKDLDRVIKETDKNGTYTFVQTISLTNKDKSVVFATVDKEIYVATKEYYSQRKKQRGEA